MMEDHRKLDMKGDELLLNQREEGEIVIDALATNQNTQNSQVPRL